MSILSCKDTAALVSKACDIRLSWGGRLAVRLHLLVCRGCRQFLQQVRFMRLAGGYSREHDHETHGEVVLPEAARERIAVRISNENKPRGE